MDNDSTGWLQCGQIARFMVEAGFSGERLGSGDGERKTLLTRRMACEPLPASVLLNEAATRE